MAGTYDASRDPWKRGDLAAFRREFYQKSMQWLSSPGIRTYPVSEIFVWGMASWDMFGIYPDSTTGAGTYRDFSLMPEIAKHNIAVIGAKVRRRLGECKQLGGREGGCRGWLSPDSTPRLTRTLRGLRAHTCIMPY